MKEKNDSGHWGVPRVSDALLAPASPSCAPEPGAFPGGAAEPQKKTLSLPELWTYIRIWPTQPTSICPEAGAGAVSGIRDPAQC